MAGVQQELVVRGEQIERVFINYNDRKYIVNRRYQRKLIWTIEEKQSFIDSILRGYPVPIVLLAEPAERRDGAYEIIDGMQRMNAITSFIANDFPVEGEYFDLNTFATAKALMDEGLLQQHTPVMDRAKCLAISAYPLPLSIYEFADGESVDEVFRRINSGGRQLSRQELRSAGATNQFATTVRLISSKVRGDSSSTDTLLLNDMKKISITNRELDYGINVEDVFWVKQGILSRDNLRQSRDEEMVADLVAYMVSDAAIPSRSELIDAYFADPRELEGSNLERSQAIDQAVRRRTAELVEYDFLRVHDAITLLLARADVPFVNLIFPDGHGGNPVPRYYQAVFLAFHHLIVRNAQVVANVAAIIDRLRNSGRNITIQEGGRWGADSRQAAVDSVVGWIQGAFENDRNPDPAKVHWVSRLQNLLINSTTEQPAYDLKQGFFSLSDNPAFDELSFEKILVTCSAIANIRPGHRGYVIVGVAETAATAARVHELFGVSPSSYEGFYITGVEHEAQALGKNLDQLFQDLANRIERSELSEPLKSYMTSHLKMVRYYDKHVVVLEVEGQAEPSLFDGKFFERRGAQVFEVPAASLSGLFARFR
ncbi:DUF262 domain-containing protein [Paracoccus sp. WLY502]|uniref:DUF262 domain-containing protein n=1 Tax=Paracoccus yibinensis TaxID=3068891 RepID=UPI002796DD5D|nr:DUF262 domain-containing protein [Paracoccus sp. WLY502]MDQ1901794.1 DUF262 domain-containing protein [Paracoccus sp. WLY502]